MNIINQIIMKISDPVYAAAQIIGFVPILLSFFIFIHNDRRKVIAFKMISDFLYAVHFFMLGEMTGAVINLINTLRGYVFSKKYKKWASGIYIPILFCVIVFISTVLSWSGIRSVFPLAGSCLAIWGFWSKNIQNVRKFNFMGIVLWLIYGIIVGSVPTILYNVAAVASIVFAEIKAVLAKAHNN